MKTKLILIASLLWTMAHLAWSQNNQKPEAMAGKDTVIMDLLPTQVTLDGSLSSDADGDILQYYWLLGEDTISTQAIFDYALDTAYANFQLIVRDDSLATDRDFKQVFIGHPTNHGLNRIPFRENQPVFASGMNIAWYRFANDLDSYDASAQAYFQEIMDSISNNGGNSLRWWLHTNGAHSPIIDESGFVTGVDQRTIQTMKHVLDQAFDHGIAISMCLWSFDMLQDGQQQNPEVMRKLLEDPTNIQSYIDNALVPILDALGDHPAVLTWEIFNEPEGMTNQFGWSGAGRVEMSDIQRFVNLVTGAIHRTVPGSLVSNGSWSFRASTDVGGNLNYYRDDALIAAGGDVDGTLDFFQVHFYAEHFNNDLSPFHRPASHWGLDKPIVIGEFRSWGIEGQTDPTLSTEQAYDRAYEFGYAGAIAWSWTDSPKDIFTRTMGAAMQSIYDENPADFAIDNSGVELERNPELVTSIEHLRRALDEAADIENYVDLTQVFTDHEDGSDLEYLVTRNEDTTLVKLGISETGSLGIDFQEGSTGLTRVGVSAVDSDGWTAESSFFVMVKDRTGHEDNLAFLKPVKSSSLDNSDHHEIFINDGSNTTRWSSAYADDEWVSIDFEEEVELNYLRLNWEVAHAASYDIQISEDGQSWETARSIAESDGDLDIIVFDNPLNTQYLRVLGLDRATQWGFSIYELIAKNIESNQAPTVLEVVSDYSVNLSEVAEVRNFLDFEDIFSDLEDADALEFDWSLSNENLIILELASDGHTVNLDFIENTVGSTVVTLSATDPFGETTTTAFNVTVIDDLLSFQVREAFQLYPNPTSGPLWLDKLGITPDSYQLFDFKGRLMKAGKIEDSFIDLSYLKSGIYMIRFQELTGRVEEYRLVKE